MGSEMCIRDRGHAISYLDDRKDIEDSLLAEIIFGNSINTTSIAQKCIQMGYEKSVLTHFDRKSCFQRTTAPTIDPAIRKASHFFVVIAPTTIATTINVAISP